MADLKLSLCMIVKDEEACIRRCLDSVKDVADEIVVVDTGSSDRTIGICRSYGAAIYPYKWNDSFADARNESLAHASGDFILWMDADEALDPVQGKRLKAHLADRTASLFYLHLINYLGDHEDPDNTYHIAHARLFRNGIGFRFQFNIHETLNLGETLPEMTWSEIPVLPVQIHHYGYLSDYTERKHKSERNLRLLLKEWNQEDHSPWVEYHIASEYARIGRYEESFAMVNAAIAAFLQAGRMPPSLLYKLKYSNLIALGSIDGAWPAIDKAIKLYPDYVDLHFYKGVIFYLKQWYARALAVFDRCLEMGEGNIRHLVLKGTGSFHAWYYKGLCYERLGSLDQAEQAYAAALRLAPGYTIASDALFRLRGEDNRGSKSESTLR